MQNFFSFDFKNIDLRNLDSWPQPIKNTATLATGILALLVIFLILIVPQYSALSAAHQQEATLKQNLLTEIPTVVSMNAQKKQLQQLKMLMQQYTPYLSKEDQLGTLLDDITHAAADNQLDLLLLKPLTMIQSGFYATIPIQVELNGNYQQLGLFLNQLAQLPYFFYPNELTLNLPESKTAAIPGTLHLTMLIDMNYESLNKVKDPA